MTAGIYHPVIILGAPRAGTSILGRLLQEHPEFVHAREPRLVWRYGNDRFSDQLSAQRARPEVAAHIRSYFADVVSRGAGSRLLEKTPSNALRVPFVEKVFPDAVYVHVIRNGFHSAASIRSYWQNGTQGVNQTRIGARSSILRQRLREASLSQLPNYAWEFACRVLPNRQGQPRTLWGPRLPGLAKMVRDMTLIEVAAMQWRQCTELAAHDGRALAPGRYMEVRLEDLTLDKLEAILLHVGLDMHDNVAAAYTHGFDRNMPSRKLDQLSDIDRHSLRRILTPTMQWLGYDEPE